MGALSFRSESVQRLRSLCRRRAARWEAGCFVVEGPKLLGEALDAGHPVQAVFVEEASAGEDTRALVRRAARQGAAVKEVAPGVLSRVADAVAPQPLAAVVPMLHREAASLEPGGTVLVCAGLQDPGNTGTVIRSAAASGASAVVICAGGADLYNPKTVRASAGAMFQVPLVCGPDPAASLELLGRLGHRRLGAAARRGEAYDATDLTGPTAVVLGSESHGLGADIERFLDGWITIPMRPGTESLNVAMAATVICFESARQSRNRPAP